MNPIIEKMLKHLTLEKMLKLTKKVDGKEVSPEFCVTVKEIHDMGVHLSIHPKESDADDVVKEYMVSDNILTDMSGKKQNG